MLKLSTLPSITFISLSNGDGRGKGGLLAFPSLTIGNTKSLKIILRVVNVLSRNPEGMLSVGDIYPGGGGRGVPSVVLCLYYRESLFNVFSTFCRGLAERIRNVVAYHNGEAQERSEYCG